MGIQNANRMLGGPHLRLAESDQASAPDRLTDVNDPPMPGKPTVLHSVIYHAANAATHRLLTSKGCVHVFT
jgi:hypothetical protein